MSLNSNEKHFIICPFNMTISNGVYSQSLFEDLHDKIDFIDDLSLTIYDNKGNSIIKESVKGNEHRMNLSDLPDGIYIISLTSKQGNIVRKFVKNNTNLL